ncbi:MAG: hypothetical protein DCF26_05835 [Burkholderiales bacterium]|nr:MAG: hypothetical protein DCF26_05835 [Burkholderiales bacterium]
MDFFSAVRCARRGLTAGALIAVVPLAGCYVVPINPHTGQAVPLHGTTVVSAPAVPLTVPARLYPANDLASGYGVVNATVTNDLHGRGSFHTNINGETFTGEATRKVGSGREGVASGAGNRCSYLSCTYTMNSATLGSGSCRLSSGALFSMHVGN